jgi:endoglucanase
MPVSRRSFVSACVLTGAAAAQQEAPNKNDFVRVHGTKLVAPTHEKLLLRGINLGNWFVPEGYMFRFDGPQSPREIETFFNELIGPSAAKAFWSEYRRNYITKADIDFIRNSGLNSVRIPLHYKFFLASDEGFAILDPIVAVCRQAGLWVVLDLHCAPGGQTGTNIDDSWSYPWLFESAAEQQSTIDVWVRIAQHYRDETTVLGFDLLNEPNPQFPGTPKYNGILKSLYQRIVRAIREVDRNHILILGGAQWDTNFGIFDWPMDSKVMYTFHNYGTPPTQENLDPDINFADQYNAPLWLGESGENTDAWIQQFVQLLEKNHVGWCFWPYKKMEKPSCMVSISKPAYWDEILAFAKQPGGTSNAAARIAVRPSLEHSQAAADELLTNIRFEKCRVNTGYLQALGLNVTANSQS